MLLMAIALCHAYHRAELPTRSPLDLRNKFEGFYVRILGVDPGTRGYGVGEVPAVRTAVCPRYIECGVIEL